ncbi:MAG TPA: precorrin-3B synthase [Roseiarcus sp.]|nr:precorrin-3B synthase [Roseiarcus sp.]
MSALPQQRKGWCPGALKPMPTGDGLLARVRASGGRLALDQAAAIADAAIICGNGVVALSSRANIQIRGVSERSLPDLRARLAGAGLLDFDPEVERLRNIVVSPLSDIDPDAAFDLAPCVAALEARLKEDETLRLLPAKFGFVLDADGRLPLSDIDADIRFEAAREEVAAAFAVHLAGDDSRAAICAAADLADTAARLARAFLSFNREALYPPLPARGEREGARGLETNGENVRPRPSLRPSPCARGQGTLNDILHDDDDKPRRMRALVPRMGSATVFTAAGLTTTPRTRSPRRTSLNDSLGARDYKGAAVVGATAPFGHIEADRLKVLIARARDAGAADLRLAPWRTFFVTGLKRDAAASIAAACKDLGFITDANDARLRVAACPGAPACLHAHRPVREDAARWAAVLPAGDGVLLHMSGCAKGCARPLATAATLVATEAGYDLVLGGKASDAPSLNGLSSEAVGAWLMREGAKLFASEARS